MTYIKVVRRLARWEYEVYDIYFDVGLFSPLIKNWVLDKTSLTREEAIKYLTPWLVDIAGVKIYVTTKKS